MGCFGVQGATEVKGTSNPASAPRFSVLRCDVVPGADEMNVCPHCGAPLDTKDEEPRQLTASKFSHMEQLRQLEELHRVFKAAHDAKETCKEPGTSL